MDFFSKHLRNLVGASFAGLALAAVSSFGAVAQGAPSTGQEPNSIALPLPEDRGAAALEQSMRRLQTTASLLAIVAHPDDEDGALLTYLSREMGVRCTLLTLTRGEGGQNAIGPETYDALGLIRTNELLKAGEFYGVKQLWGTEVDFGFSKTREEAFSRWGHDRVLYDAVLAVRRERPEVIVSTFVGGVTDGHGHHQVSGEIAQEAFTAAADPKIFPEMLKPVSEGGLGLTVWQPLAVYSRAPFAPVSDKGMFDYATGKWAPAKFKNYVTGEWTTGVLSADVTVETGRRDPVLGRSPAQIAREGWGMQKSQYGGANPALSGPAATRYHLWAVAPEAAAKPGVIATNDDLFHNSKVDIDTALTGPGRQVSGLFAGQIRDGLKKLDTAVKQFDEERKGLSGPAAADKLAAIYRQALTMQKALGGLDGKTRSALSFEGDIKIAQFQEALRNLLGIDVIAFTTHSSTIDEGGFQGGGSDETARSVTPGESFNVRIHASSAVADVHLSKVALESPTSGASTWQVGEPVVMANTDTTSDGIYKLKVPDDAQPTEPYFSRPNIEQAYYDLSAPQYRERSFAPWPLAAWAEFTYQGLPIHVGAVVQTLQRVLGTGGIYQPLVVTPAIGIRMEPEARILPLDGSALPVRVTVHAENAAEGTMELKLPDGWTAQPTSTTFHFNGPGDAAPIPFMVTPGGQSADGSKGVIKIQAVAKADGHTYEAGWQSVGYAGLRPYNLYRPAQLLTRKVDVKLAPGLRIGYIMGTGDQVPDAIEALGAMPHLLTFAEVNSSDFSSWNVLVVGIRAYSARPELMAAQARLKKFVEDGGTLIVQYQSGDFPAPYPLKLGRSPERVVDESDPVKLLAAENPLLKSPNNITPADFDGWVEERGHSFLESWDPAYTALTETADPGQDPQRGGLVVAHPGKGTFVYVSYALYRQLPELVPGAYRILANLLSAGR